MDEHEQHVVDMIYKLTGKYNTIQIFCDWVALSALAINSEIVDKNKDYVSCQEKYKNIASKYTGIEMTRMCVMLGELVLAMEENISDHLGNIYMTLSCSNKQAGQFFTPYQISKMVAKMMVAKENDEKIILNESACGSGSMIIAVAQAMKEKGIDYKTQLIAYAQDLDWTAVYMTYIQLTLLDIQAIVTQKNALEDATTETGIKFITPACIGIKIL